MAEAKMNRMAAATSASDIHFYPLYSFFFFFSA
jgi:hypothetical protein